MQKKSPKKCSAIIFDLDGTLIDSLPLHVQAFQEVLQEKNVPIRKAVLRRKMGIPSSVLFKELKRKYRLKDSLQELRDERRAHFFRLLNKKNILFPNAILTLKELRKKYKIAIATGSSRVVYLHSTNKKLRSLLNAIVVYDDVKRWKPFPDQFLLAAKKLRAKPEECLVVGDSIFDVIAAKRAGMQSIGVATGYHSTAQLKKYGAMNIVRNLRELSKML